MAGDPASTLQSERRTYAPPRSVTAGVMPGVIWSEGPRFCLAFLRPRLWGVAARNPVILLSRSKAGVFESLLLRQFLGPGGVVLRGGGLVGWRGSSNTAASAPTRNPPSAAVALLCLDGASRRASPFRLAPRCAYEHA